MLVDGQPFRTVWIPEEEPEVVRIIDQRRLPFVFTLEDLRTTDEVACVIQDMWVRGAGCIGATAGFGMWLATKEAATDNDFDTALVRLSEKLRSTRPTAVNLAWAIDRQLEILAQSNEIPAKIDAARATAQLIADEDAAACRSIGEHGVKILEEISRAKNGEPVNVLTHCNAGWLAFVDYGSATAPIYAAHDKGIPVHVWVDETRPRNQGARLTAWELLKHGVPHTVIVDNAGGHLMRTGQVDLVITGTDRTTYTGDVCNKIGTYLKATAAKDCGLPFYVALPSSTFDWKARDGLAEVPIEQRSSDEVALVDGLLDGAETSVRILLEGSATANPAFDVTPARLVTGLITERGVCEAGEESILDLFPEKR
ncbi:MAG: S-methyl-5-thioribose-1-phosphate isomerase [Opitutales bacterium]|nr:S-methyl-5-thioribose-1-phosphate isomerase [Opitutales bacterium]|tara:strand:- start:559 stop:1665 length:1107 start_codon:yes stop_codon:yes gene_type:complete